MQVDKSLDSPQTSPPATSQLWSGLALGIYELVSGNVHCLICHNPLHRYTPQRCRAHDHLLGIRLAYSRACHRWRGSSTRFPTWLDRLQALQPLVHRHVMPVFAADHDVAARARGTGSTATRQRSWSATHCLSVVRTIMGAESAPAPAASSLRARATRAATKPAASRFAVPRAAHAVPAGRHGANGNRNRRDPRRTAGHRRPVAHLQCSSPPRPPPARRPRPPAACCRAAVPRNEHRHTANRQRVSHLVHRGLVRVHGWRSREVTAPQAIPSVLVEYRHSMSVSR